MKRLFFTLFITFISFSAVNAQNWTQSDADQKVKKMIKKKTMRMAEDLALTEKQQTEIQTTYEEFYLNKRNLMQLSKEKNMDKEDVKRRMAALKNNQIASFRDILTGKQYEKYKNHLDEEGGYKMKRNTSSKKMKQSK